MPVSVTGSAQDETPPEQTTLVQGVLPKAGQILTHGRDTTVT